MDTRKSEEGIRKKCGGSRGWEFVDLGDGVTMTRFKRGVWLRPSTREDFDYINENMRCGDLDEELVAGVGRNERIETMEKSWTVMHDGDILGFVSHVLVPGDTYLSRRRLLAAISTENVWGCKTAFVANTPAIRDFVLSNAPPWVDDFFTVTLKRYTGAVRWIERVIGMKKANEILINGHPHVIFHIGRKR